MQLAQASYIVIAGTKDGSILIWNLKESNSPQHIFAELDAQDILYKLPCYSTDGIYGLDQTHQGSIIQIFNFSDDNGENMNGKNDFYEKRTYQIASLDIHGYVQFWTIHEISELESQKFIDTDYGLAIGSELRLIRGGGFNLDTTSDEAKCIGVRASQLHPNSADKFIVATDTGMILNESKFRTTCFPKEFRLNPPSFLRPADSTVSIDFNHHVPIIFLAAYESGIVALFHKCQETPLVTWKLSCAARVIAWSAHRPALFYALDEKSVLHIWDLLEHEATPTYIIALGDSSARKGEKRRAVALAQSPAFTVSSSLAGTLLGSTSSLASSAGKNASLTVSYANGDIEVYFLNEELVEVGVDETQQFNYWVDLQFSK
ncbi:WD repeat-containing protein 60 [Physocladia obscura]|uniref:WD repeat-containing protein 60 n=1 Tax=Physocladia obscura TaxID=109957 RepID=A0AAD5SZU8_9FUNG|nr:WD repeat-containing protein 60 [Physocladia obscura]